jgi:hypothetical protein
MAVLLWLMIPFGALIVGIVWVYLISRPARPAAMQDSMDSFNRFRHALAQQSRPPREPVARASATADKSTGSSTRTE